MRVTLDAAGFRIGARRSAGGWRLAVSRPYSYNIRFVTGFMDPSAKAVTEVIDTLDHGREGLDLWIRQHAPLPDTEEGQRIREGLHRLVDAWLDGVEFQN